MATTVIQIGNSDDKLTQAQWAHFILRVDNAVRSRASQIHFSGTSHPAAEWQNAAWVFDIEETPSLRLNDDGLRSKPVGLYVDLFKPTIPPTEKRKALVLYGGSGNAAIAAEALGYEVTVIEQDPKRCELIEKRSSRLVQTWREKLSQGNLWGFPTQPAPDAGESAPLQGSFYTPAESKSQALSTPTQRG